MQSKKRVMFFDAAKLLSMIAIIAGHTSYQRTPFTVQLVFSFHVAAFYLINGYFWKYTDDTKAYLKKILKAYIVPYAVTCILMVGIAVLQNILKGEPWQPAFERWTSAAFYGSGGRKDFSFWPVEVYSIGAIWFLLAVFWGNFFMHLIEKFARKMEKPGMVKLVTVLGIAYAGYYTAKSCWLPFSIQAGMCATIFLYMGTLFRQAGGGLFKGHNLPVWMRIMMFGIWMYCAVFYGKLYLVDNTFTNGFMDVIGALCGTYCVLEFCRLWEKHIRIGMRTVAYAGRFTLPMLCVHILELNLLDYWAHILPFFQQIGVPLNWYTVVLCRLMVVFFGTALLSILPVVNRWFGVYRYRGLETRRQRVNIPSSSE